jgi:hypothetical protein
VRVIDEADSTLTFEVNGNSDGLPPLPPELHDVLVSTESRSRSFNGDMLVGLAVTIPWATLASEFLIHLLGSWVYDAFRGKREARDTAATTITINGDIVVVSDGAQVAEVLKALGRPSDR